MLQCRTCDLKNLCKFVEPMESLPDLKLPPGIHITGACTKHKEAEIEPR